MTTNTTPDYNVEMNAESEFVIPVLTAVAGGIIIGALAKH